MFNISNCFKLFPKRLRFDKIRIEIRIDQLDLFDLVFNFIFQFLVFAFHCAYILLYKIN